MADKQEFVLTQTKSNDTTTESKQGLSLTKSKSYTDEFFHTENKQSLSVTPINNLKEDYAGVGGAAIYTLGNVATGFISVFENIGKLVKGTSANLSGDSEYAKYIFQEQTLSQAANEQLKETYNPGKAAQVAGDIGSGLGQSLAYLGMYAATAGAGALVSGAAGTAGAATGAAASAASVATKIGGVALRNAPIFLSAMGGSMQNATNMTNELGFKEYMYGTLSATTETLLEQISVGGIAKTVTTGTNALTKTAVKYSGSKLAQKFTKHAVLTGMVSAGGGEFVEEFTSSLLDPLWQKWTGVNPNAKVDFADALYSGMVGFASGSILGGGSSAARTLVENRTGAKIHAQGKADNVITDAKATLQAGKTSMQTSENYRILNTLVSSYESMKNKDSTTAKNLLGKISGQLAQMSVESVVQDYVNVLRENATVATMAEVNKWLGAEGKIYTLEEFKANKDDVARKYAAWLSVYQSQLETRQEKILNTLIKGDAQRFTAQSLVDVENMKNGDDMVFDFGHDMFAVMSRGGSGQYAIQVVDRTNNNNIVNEQSFHNAKEAFDYSVAKIKDLINARYQQVKTNVNGVEEIYTVDTQTGEVVEDRFAQAAAQKNADEQARKAAETTATEATEEATETTNEATEATETTNEEKKATKKKSTGTKKKSTTAVARDTAETTAVASEQATKTTKKSTGTKKKSTGTNSENANSNGENAGSKSEKGTSASKKQNSTRKKQNSTRKNTTSNAETTDTNAEAEAEQEPMVVEPATLDKVLRNALERNRELMEKPEYGKTKKIAGAEQRRLVRTMLQETTQRLQVWLVNAQAGIEKTLVDAGLSRERAATKMQMVRTASNRAYAAIFIAQYNQSLNKPRKIGESLMQILAPVMVNEELSTDWLDYQYHMLNVERRKASNDERSVFANFPAQVSLAYANEILDKHPEFEEVSKKLKAFNDNLNEMRVRAGLITKEVAANLAHDYSHYFPAQRITGRGQAKSATDMNANVRQSITEAFGSESPLANGLDNYIKQIIQVYNSCELNNLYSDIYGAVAEEEDDVLDDDGDYDDDGDDIDGDYDIDGELFDLDEENITNTQKNRKENEQRNGILAYMDKNNNRAYSLTFYKGGKTVSFNVDYTVYEGCRDLAHATMTEFEHGLKFLNNMMSGFKKLVTSYNPIFAVKNAIRDPSDAMFNTEGSVVSWMKNFVEAERQILSGNSPMWEEYVCMGGLSSSIFEEVGGGVLKTDKNGNYIYGDQMSKRFLKKAHGVFKGIQLIDNMNILLEAGPRFAEYIMRRKKGHSVDTALYHSSEVTQNFGRSGSVAKKLNRYLIPFLTASIGGLDKQVRRITGIYYNAKASGNFTKTLTKGIGIYMSRLAILGLIPIVIGNLMYGDDDEYVDMQDSVKENNYMFKIGDVWIKIPRGRVQSVYAGLGNRTMRAVSGQSVDWGDYLTNVSTQITPVDTITRTIFSPFSDVANNKTWYGGVIEDASQTRKSPENRYDESTSTIAIRLGNILNYSPKKIHYLLDQYTGIIGDIILPMTAKAGTQNFAVNGFTVNAEKSSRISKEFSELYQEVQYKKNDGDEKAYYQLKYLDRAKKSVNQLWDEIDKIQANEKLSNQDKLAQVKAVRILINNTYKSAMQDYEYFESALGATEAIVANYGVTAVTKSNQVSLGLDEEDVGLYAVTYNGKGIRVHEDETKAQDYMTTQSRQVAFAEANRLAFGAERAIKEYSAPLYEKASALNSVGIDWQTFYEYYFQVKYLTGSDTKQQMVKILENMGVYSGMQSLLLYSLGYKTKEKETEAIAYVNSMNLSASEKANVLKTLGLD